VAEMMSELNLQAAASVTPVRAMGCSGAEQCEEASAAQAEGENSGREDERAEAAELKLQAAARASRQSGP
jgi:hypothetical protein